MGVAAYVFLTGLFLTIMDEAKFRVFGKRFTRIFTVNYEEVKLGSGLYPK